MEKVLDAVDAATDKHIERYCGTKGFAGDCWADIMEARRTDDVQVLDAVITDPNVEEAYMTKRGFYRFFQVIISDYNQGVIDRNTVCIQQSQQQ